MPHPYETWAVVGIVGLYGMIIFGMIILSLTQQEFSNDDHS